MVDCTSPWDYPMALRVTGRFPRGREEQFSPAEGDEGDTRRVRGLLSEAGPSWGRETCLSRRRLASNERAPSGPAKLPGRERRVVFRRRRGSKPDVALIGPKMGSARPSRWALVSWAHSKQPAAGAFCALAYDT